MIGPVTGPGADGVADRSRSTTGPPTPLSTIRVKTKMPSQRLLILLWQVLGSNQRRRCRRFYRPPPKLAPTRKNSAVSRSVGIGIRHRQLASANRCLPDILRGTPPDE